MTARERAMGVLAEHTVEKYSRSDIEFVFACAIEQAEERGRVEMREKCDNAIRDNNVHLRAMAGTEEGMQWVYVRILSMDTLIPITSPPPVDSSSPGLETAETEGS